jgi:hypothetical protein
MNRTIVRSHQVAVDVRQGIWNMDENAGPALRDPISARRFDRRSSEPRWSLLLLALIAGDTVDATIAWFLVGLFFNWDPMSRATST